MHSPGDPGEYLFIPQVKGVEHVISLAAKFLNCRKSRVTVPLPTDCLQLADFIGSVKEFVVLFESRNQTSGKSLQNIARYLLR
jgi:hypothetical protein